VQAVGLGEKEGGTNLKRIIRIWRGGGPGGTKEGEKDCEMKLREETGILKEGEAGALGERSGGIRGPPQTLKLGGGAGGGKKKGGRGARQVGL